MTGTEVRTIATTMPTRRLILTSGSSHQAKSSQTYILHPMDKKLRCPQMLLSLSSPPPFSMESFESTPPVSSNCSQLPLEIIDRQLGRCKESSRTSITSVPESMDDAIPCPSGLPQHLPLDIRDGDDDFSAMTGCREIPQSSAEIEDIIHSWKSDRFNVSQSAPKRNTTRPAYIRSQSDPDRGRTMRRVSGMKRSPSCRNFRSLDDFDTDNNCRDDDDRDHLQKRSRSSFDSDIDNEANDPQFDCALFF